MGLAGAAGLHNTERLIPMATVQQARGRSHSHDLVCQSDFEQIVATRKLPFRNWRGESTSIPPCKSTLTGVRPQFPISLTIQLK